MATGVKNPGWSTTPAVDTQLDPRENVVRATIERLLLTESYGELARLIAARRAAPPAPHDPTHLAVLNAVEQLCQTCIQLRQQRRDHERTLQQTARLEADTRHLLEQLLVSIWPADEAGQTPASLGATAANAPRPRPFVRLRAAVGRWLAAFAAGPGEAAAIPANGVDLVLPEEPALGDPAPLSPESAATGPSGQTVAASTPAGALWPAPDLRIYCLGDFRVFAGDQPIVDWTSHKSRSLLKYMLLHRDRPATAEQLLTVFWRDSPPEAARRSLYQTIYLLRQAVRPPGDRPCVVQVNGGYLLNPDLDVWIDVEALLCHYHAALSAGADSDRASEALAAAEALYGGDLMVEETYEDWPVARREEARDAYLDILDRLSRHYETAGDDERCLAYGRKLLDIDNCREDIYRRLMRVYARRGERNLALRQYHRCVAALRAELDVEPLPETTALYVKILNNGESAGDERFLNRI